LRKFIILVVMAAMLASLGVAQAAERHLTADPLDSATWNVGGGLFALGDWTTSTGTGVFDTFLAIGATPTESGINTSDFPPNDKPQTRALQLFELPTMLIDGDLYREFRLDVNQNGNEATDFISLDTVRIYQSPSFSPDGDAAWTEIYNMGSTDWVKVPGSTGSGGGDMALYILNSEFTQNPDDYIALYSDFGGNGGWTSNDGFEEWGVWVGQAPPIPEGSSILLALSGLPTVGMLGWLRRKRHSR
jgi:hypothetical protein